MGRICVSGEISIHILLASNDVNLPDPIEPSRSTSSPFEVPKTVQKESDDDSEDEEDDEGNTEYQKIHGDLANLIGELDTFIQLASLGQAPLLRQVNERGKRRKKKLEGTTFVVPSIFFFLLFPLSFVFILLGPR